MVTVFHDMQHKRHPEWATFLDLLGFTVFYGLSARRSKRLIAVSAATKEDMVRYYRMPPQKIKVIPHGVDSSMFEVAKRRTYPDAKLILCVSTLHPHKNLDRLIRAFADFHRDHSEYCLAIVGLNGSFSEDLRKLVLTLGLSDSVRLTGWIERERVYDLFSTASAFIYPSLFEGFGLPILEALAAGLPSACSDIKPLKQIVGDAALLFNPHKDSALVDALNKLVDDDLTRSRLIAAGPARASRFPWHRTARATLRVLKSAAIDASPA
jgi:glycosyltransferase involved in cell wall biosynthesis